MTNNTIPNVPRELLERVASQPARGKADYELRALLSAPSPAGVDGLEVVSNWVLFDAEADKPYIKKMLPEGFLAFFDCEEDARRAKANNPGADYKRIDRVKAEDAQAIIDGLRGEADQQAQRIGELASHLEFAVTMLTVAGLAGNAQVEAMRSALSAGHEPQ